MYFAVRLLRRVFLPIVISPQGVVGGRPAVERASPPPCGWSTGFIATPRTWGRRPSQRERPALPTLVFMLDVAQLPDGRAAGDRDLADFARGHAHLRVIAFLGHELRGAAGRAHELAALAGRELDIVDDRA